MTMRELREALDNWPDDADDDPFDLPWLLSVATGSEDLPERLRVLLDDLADPESEDDAIAIEAHILLEKFGWA